MKLELFYPVKPNKVNQKFGENATAFYKQLGMLGHNGIDFSAKRGQLVRAAHDGIVTFTGEDGSGGLGIVIRTLNQREYGTGTTYFKTIYWHLQKDSFQVKAGDIVRCGQILGAADNTGMSTDDHLHFGLKPIQQGEQDWQWYNVESTNGYNGAIDPTSRFNGMFAEDYRTISDQLALIAQKVGELLKLIFKK